MKNKTEALKSNTLENEHGRVLARRLARELTREELDRVSGAACYLDTTAIMGGRTAVDYRCDIF